MKKVVLVNSPLNDREQGGSFYSAVGRSIPYGLVSIASSIRQSGYQVIFIDAANSGYGIMETVNKITFLDADYVGISAVTVSIKNAAAVARELKLRDSRVTIILGGVHVSALPEQTLQEYEDFDIGVIGEGEETITDLLRALDTGIPLAGIPGIIYRSPGGVVKTSHRPFIRNLDSLPMPAWDLLPDMGTFYRLSATSYTRLPAATIVTSRGCSGNCIFCSSKAMFGQGRFFSAEYVMRMIRHLISEYRVKDISIYDDNFIFLKDRVRELCRMIKEENLDFVWSCYSRVDHGDPELFRCMKDAGCWQISYGIESGSQRILDLIGKGVTIGQIEKTVLHTKKAGLRARGFFIIGHLSEDRRSVLETLKLLVRLPLDDFHSTYFTPFPGTRASYIAPRYGSLERSWEKMNMFYPVFIPSRLSRKELEYYSKAAYRKFYFRLRIIGSYLLILLKHPENLSRVLNGARAVLCKIFSRER